MKKTVKILHATLLLCLVFGILFSNSSFAQGDLLYTYSSENKSDTPITISVEMPVNALRFKVDSEIPLTLGIAHGNTDKRISLSYRADYFFSVDADSCLHHKSSSKKELHDNVHTAFALNPIYTPVNEFREIRLKYRSPGYYPHKCVITVRAKDNFSNSTLAETNIYFATDGKYGAFSLESFDDVLDRLNIDPDYIYEPRSASDNGYLQTTVPYNF